MRNVVLVGVCLLVGFGLLWYVGVAKGQEGGVDGKLFCTTGYTYNACFTLEAVTLFYPPERILVLNGLTWTLPESDWTRLVEFGKGRGFLLPKMEVSNGK